MATNRFENAYVPDIVPQEDLEYFEKGGHGARMGWGENPAVLVVDMTAQFTDDEYSLGRSDTGSQAVSETGRLLRTAREADVPIVYTRGPDERFNVDAYRGIRDEKKNRRSYDSGGGNEIHPELAPDVDDVVIEKPNPSAFFDTHLANMLRQYSVDTVVVTGMTTSGCVRATAVDAQSSNFHAIVPVECVADRSSISHEIALFDLDMKYADVTPLDDVLAKLRE